MQNNLKIDKKFKYPYFHILYIRMHIYELKFEDMQFPEGDPGDIHSGNQFFWSTLYLLY